MAYAVSNKLQPKALDTQTCKYMSNGQEITLSINIVRQYKLPPGSRITDGEIVLYINLCKHQGLNPWLNEAYLVKYGDHPAQLIVSKEAFMKRAETNPLFDGFEAGVITIGENVEGLPKYREGSLVLDGERLVGGWAKVYRKDRKVPVRAEVAFNEYVGLKDGKPNSMWATKPATMIRKVALMQALREAFPTNLGGMYTAEEQNLEEPEVQYAEAMPQVAASAQPEPAQIQDDSIVGDGLL